MQINVNVTPTTFDPITNSAVLMIEFVNDSDFTYAANSNIYYYALLTDSTSPTPQTEEVIFTVPETTSGTIPANTTKQFTIENSQNLVPDITGVGAIYYIAE